MKVWRRDYFLPLILVVLGIYFLLHNFHLIDWLTPNIIWPVVLIILGVWLIARRSRA
jgi:Domain of unknown function (DUF5668)